MQFDAEKSDGGAVTRAAGCRIAGIERSIDPQDLVGGRLHEARLSEGESRPHVTVVRYCTDDDERQLRKEGLMLLGHVIPDEASSDAVHLLHDADLFLQLQFALMPGRLYLARYRVHDMSPRRNLSSTH